MSVFRLWRLPLDLHARKIQINQAKPLLFALVFSFTYFVLAVYTIVVLITAAKALWTPPRTIYELFSVAYVCAGYPLVYLGFEWALYYSAKPIARK